MLPSGCLSLARMQRVNPIFWTHGATLENDDQSILSESMKLALWPVNTIGADGSGSVDRPWLFT